MTKLSEGMVHVVECVLLTVRRLGLGLLVCGSTIPLLQETFRILRSL